MQRRPLFASRSEKFQLSPIRKFFGMVRPGAINLTLGEPDFNPPRNVRHALIRALEEGYNKYTPSQGIPELRQALAVRLARFSPDITADGVLVTVGASEALFLTAATLYEPGDEVLIPDPGFTAYAPHVRYCRAEPVPYPLDGERDWRPDLEKLKGLVSPKTKAIVVNSPHNPTGGTLDEEDVKAISDLAVDHDLAIVADEVYDEIVYEGKHHSFLGRHDRVVYINSFSKTYATTGWRLGYLASTKEIVERMIGFHHAIVACPPSLTQVAAVEAILGQQESVKEMLAKFRKRRDLVVDGLNAVPGVKCTRPRGAFYVFPGFDLPLTSEQVALKLIDGGVVGVPGSAFGSKGEGHLRFSYAVSIQTLKEAVHRIHEAVQAMIDKREVRAPASGPRPPGARITDHSFSEE